MILFSISKGLLHRLGGFNFDKKYYFDPVFRNGQDKAIDMFLSEQFPALPIYNFESNLVQPAYLPKNPYYVGGIQPNLIVGAVIGSNLIFPEGNDGDIDSKPFETLSDQEELPDPESLLSHPLIRQFDNQIEELLKNGTAVTDIIPPFFWDRSGRAAIHGFITTSFKFVGEAVFLFSYENPELLSSLHRWITDTYGVLIDHFSKKADLPATSLHIGECSGALISTEQFEQYIVPFAGEMGNRYEKIRFHTCGHSDHLLPAIRKISGIASIDTGSNTSIEKIRNVFGNTIKIETAPPAELLMEESPEKRIRDWVAKTVAENGKGPLDIGLHVEPGYSINNVRALLDEGVRQKIAEPGRPPL